MNRKLFKQLFTKDPKTGVVVYDKDEPLVVSAFARYKEIGLLTVDEHIDVFGILNINYKGKDYGYAIPCMLKMDPTSVENNGDMVDFIFEKGDRFLISSKVVQQGPLSFDLIRMFVMDKLRYPWMTPTNVARIFDNMFMTGFEPAKFPHELYSAMLSELHRDPNTPKTRWRNTNQKTDAAVYGMRDLSVTASKLMTKLSGSYLRETLDAALIEDNTDASTLENILRR